MVTSKLCFFCGVGYLVAEYSRSENSTNYYCNNCFKYSTESQSNAVELLNKEESPPSNWGDFSDEEIDNLLNSIFNQSTD